MAGNEKVEAFVEGIAKIADDVLVYLAAKNALGIGQDGNEVLGVGAYLRGVDAALSLRRTQTSP